MVHRGSGFVLRKEDYNKHMMLKGFDLGRWEGRREGQFQSRHRIRYKAKRHSKERDKQK